MENFWKVFRESLSGMLGKPLWLLLSHIQDWRWLIGRSDNPWYPTARLFRQGPEGDWDPVIAGATEALAGLAAAAPSAVLRRAT